jgi:hypothetical protein
MSTDPFSTDAAHPDEDPFTRVDRAAREVFAGELTDLNPRTPPIPLVVESRRSNLQTKFELAALAARDMLRDRGVPLAEYELRLVALGRAVSAAMSYSGPMWWQLTPVGRGVRLQSLLAQAQACCEAAAALLRLAGHYCPDVGRPRFVYGEATPPMWEDLLSRLGGLLAALCPEGRPERPVGFRGELLVNVRTPAELTEWIDGEMFVHDQARSVSRPTPAGETGILRNAYCLARSLRLTGLPTEPAGALTAADEEIYLRNLMAALDGMSGAPAVANGCERSQPPSPPPGDPAGSTTPGLSAYQERRRQKEQDESQRAEQLNEARARVARLAGLWDHVQDAVPHDPEVSADCVLALAPVIEAEGLARYFDEPDAAGLPEDPDEADARAFVAGVLRSALRGDRDMVLRSLHAARREGGAFSAAAERAFTAARRLSVGRLMRDLAGAIHCHPDQLWPDYESANGRALPADTGASGGGGPALPDDAAERTDGSASGEADKPGDTSDGDESAAIPKLAPSRQKAFGQFRWAIEQNAALDGAADRDVYDWLTEHLDDGEQLPTFETWGRYLREARAAADARKNTSRGGRCAGRSIARPEQV